jgi:hypothetical protein
MKRKWFLCLAALLLALSACQLVHGPEDGKNEEQAVAEARLKTSEVVALIAEAKATGDFRALEEFLQGEDPEVRALLEEHGVFQQPAAAKAITPDLPRFTNEDGFEYANGDVLVSKGSGTAVSDIMSLVLVRGYSHAGILNQDLAEIDYESYSGCVLSADVDYLTNSAKSGALNYESYHGWQANNSVVTVLRADEAPSGDWEEDGEVVRGDMYEFFNGLDNGEDTVYAFMGYPGTGFGCFEAIPADNNKYWYCSKVPYRVFLDTIGTDIEAKEFYFDERYDRWTVFQDSLLFRLYKLYLWLTGTRWWWLTARANEGIKEALDVLITPDELRASNALQVQATFGESWFDDEVWDGMGDWNWESTAPPEP